MSGLAGRVVDGWAEPRVRRVTVGFEVISVGSIRGSQEKRY